MAYVACEDCGTRTVGGICPNCQEELYIVEHQIFEVEMSEEFAQKVAEQRRLLGERLYRNEKARRHEPGESHN